MRSQLRDVTEFVDAGCEPLCPLCDNPIELGGEVVMTNHNGFESRFLVHTTCVEFAIEDASEDGE